MSMYSLKSRRVSVIHPQNTSMSVSALAVASIKFVLKDIFKIERLVYAERNFSIPYI